MKRFLLIVMVLLLLTLPVSADVLWEPYDNAYYQMHGAGLNYMDRTYYVPEGMTANVYKSPSTGGLVQTLEAGTKFYVGPYLTLGGETWAAGYVLGNWETEGWVRLDRLQKKYEHEDFYNDFGDTFEVTDDQVTQLDFDEEVHTWTYPGSGELDQTFPKEAFWTGYNGGVMDFRYVYTDPDGGRWGYVGYFMGRCGWVYLDDPETLDAPVFPQMPENTVTNTKPEQNPHFFIWIAGMVAVLAAGSAGVIMVLKKRTRTTAGGETEHEA